MDVRPNVFKFLWCIEFLRLLSVKIRAKNLPPPKTTTGGAETPNTKFVPISFVRNKFRENFVISFYLSNLRS